MEIDLNVVKRLGIERSEEISELIKAYIQDTNIALQKTSRLQVKGIRLEFLVDETDTIFFEQSL